VPGLWFPALVPRHRTAGRNIIALPATQSLAAEVAAGSWPFLIDGTSPLHNAAAIRLLFLQVPARRLSKKKPVLFLQSPLAEVMQLVGFALPDEDHREPAAARATAAAGAGDRLIWRRFHKISIGEEGKKRMVVAWTPGHTLPAVR